MTSPLRTVSYSDCGTVVPAVLMGLTRTNIGFRLVVALSDGASGKEGYQANEQDSVFHLRLLLELR